MKDILDIINKFNSFALFCHVSPDADALGSMNALRLVLKKMNKKVFAYCDGKVPDNISFLDVKLEENEKHIQQVEVCIMLDCNAPSRVGKYAGLFDNAKNKVVIDHHQKSDYEFTYSLIDINSPSTCDLLYEIIKELNVPINSQIALNLYAGLSSDTGGFIHSSTNAMSHKHAYELLNYNFDLEMVNYNMFKYKQSNYLFFYKTALRNTKPYLNGKIYVTFFNNKAYKKYENICENPTAFHFLDGIEGNEIRVRSIEKEKDVYSISLRSNKYANVCNIAREFGGGGHIRAAGCTSNELFKDILGKILDSCQKELERSQNDRNS